MSTFSKHTDLLNISAATVGRIGEEYETEIDERLQALGDIQQMIPSMVTEVPTGNEKGACYGVHISGSDIQLLYVELSERPHAVSSVQTYTVPLNDALRTGTAEKFFAYVAERIVLFSHTISRDVINSKRNAICGLSFSFPCNQESLQSGSLTKWTKGFDLDGAIDNDPAMMLNSAFKAKGVKMDIATLCNDTVSGLCATRYCSGPRADIALTLDTGCNASYVEELSNIIKLPSESQKNKHGTMVINTEWPNFISHTLQVLPEDRQLDNESLKPGDQPFEKLTGALYLGDVARRVLLRLAEAEGWHKSLNRSIGPGTLGIEDMVAMAEDISVDLTIVANNLSEMWKANANQFSGQMRKQARDICLLVLTRSARLVGALLWGIIRHQDNCPGESNSNECIVGVTGKLYGASHVYRSALWTALHPDEGPNCQHHCPIRLYYIINGGCFGAAALAGHAPLKSPDS